MCGPVDPADIADEIAAEGQLGEPGSENHGRAVAPEVVLHDEHRGGIGRQQHDAGDDREAVDGPQQRREDEVVQEDEAEEPLPQQIHRGPAEGCGEAVDSQKREDEGLRRSGVGRPPVEDEEVVESPQHPGGPEHRVDVDEPLPVEAFEVDGPPVGERQGRPGDDEEQGDAQGAHIDTEGLEG